MNFSHLEMYRSAYLNDRDTAHHLFSACLTFAKQIISQDTPDREDIALAATWTAWEQFNTLSPTTAFGPWFVRVVRNKTTDAYRKSQARSKYEAQDFVAISPAFTLLEQRIMREDAGTESELISLLLGGYTLAESALALGITVRTAKERLSRLREAVNPNA